MLLRGASKFAKIRKQKWCLNPNESFFVITLIFALILVPYIVSAWDPYEVLGVRRDASSDQIKRAYRDLARRYHPDKASSSENDLGKKFIEINKAFDILKDPARRTRYDQFGTVDEARQPRGHHPGGGMYPHHYHRQARENWSMHNGYRTFSFYTSPDSHFRRKSINTRQYLNEYMRESKQRPFLIFFYTDFCPTCSMIESIWVKITNELAKYNVGSFAVNVHMESRLAHELGVSSIPHIACLLDGQLYHYYQSEISLANFVRFIKGLLPDNLVPLLRTADVQDRHIAQTLGQSNKLSAIIIDGEKNLKLRYHLLAYSLRHYYRFGHVSTKLSEYSTLSSHYNLSLGSKSHIVVFDERIDRPRIHLRYEPDKFSPERTLRDLLSWPFLELPRLSSQQIFDDLCLYSIPREDDRKVRKMCVVLFASLTPSSLPVREKLLEFIELNKLGRDEEVVFTYLDPLKQSEFVETITLEATINQPKSVKDQIDSNIILIQRQPDNNRKALYSWIQNQWDPSQPDQLDRAKFELFEMVNAYKKGLVELKSKTLLTVLVDEEGPSLGRRIYSRFVNSMARVLYYVTTRESFSTVVILIVCALLTSLFLYKSPVLNQYMSPESNFQYYRPPTESQGFKQTKSQATNGSENNPSTETDMNIRELKAETYNGMLRLLKPGYRSIVLLTDLESKEKLLNNFKKAVWPYRKNRTLLFGFLCLDKNLDWYRKLLEQVLGCEGLIVNKRNCIGTVLSLNGFKKYFRVYHAKHHEIDYYDDETDNDGSFLGFNDDDPELGADGTNNDANTARPAGDVYTVDNLLEKLPIWLDKMFDGLTKRYFVDKWPEEIK